MRCFVCLNNSLYTIWWYASNAFSNTTFGIHIICVCVWGKPRLALRRTGRFIKTTAKEKSSLADNYQSVYQALWISFLIYNLVQSPYYQIPHWAHARSFCRNTTLIIYHHAYHLLQSDIRSFLLYKVRYFYARREYMCSNDVRSWLGYSGRPAGLLITVSVMLHHFTLNVKKTLVT